jgi:hypothetical protein
MGSQQQIDWLFATQAKATGGHSLGSFVFATTTSHLDTAFFVKVA